MIEKEAKNEYKKILKKVPSLFTVWLS